MVEGPPAAMKVKTNFKQMILVDNVLYNKLLQTKPPIKPNTPLQNPPPTIKPSNNKSPPTPPAPQHSASDQITYITKSNAIDIKPFEAEAHEWIDNYATHRNYDYNDMLIDQVLPQHTMTPPAINTEEMDVQNQLDYSDPQLLQPMQINHDAQN